VGWKSRYRHHMALSVAAEVSNAGTLWEALQKARQEIVPRFHSDPRLWPVGRI